MYTIDSQIRFEITDPASGLPLSVADAKEHLRVDIDTEDDYIELLIKAAWGYAENYTGRPMMPITVKQYWDDFPGRSFVLYWGDVTAITSVKYYDSNNAEQTLSSSLYRVDMLMDRARIVFNSTASIPSVYDRPNAVWVEYDAGKAAVPDDMLHAMKLVVGELYEKRENTVKQLPTVAEWFLAQYRLWQI